MKFIAVILVIGAALFALSAYGSNVLLPPAVF